MQAVLYYVHDPMCSWCYAFMRSYNYLKQNLPDDIVIKRLLGGLARDTEEDMPEEMRQGIQSNWHRIQQTVTDVKFNFDFWENCQPRRATYMACRAVIAARDQGMEFDEKMTHAIQQAYYLHAKNPSYLDTLVEVAGEIGLAKEKFSESILTVNTNEELMQEIHLSRQLGISSFPSLLLQTENTAKLIPHDYNHPEEMIVKITDVT